MLAASLLAAISVSASQLNYVSNGDFESPTVAPQDQIVFDPGDPLQGWSVYDGQVSLFNSLSPYKPIEKFQSLVIGHGSIFQSFSTKPGTSYSLSFDVSSGDDSPFALQFGVEDPIGPLIYGLVFGNEKAPNRVSYEFNFSAESDGAYVIFGSVPGYGSTILDNVSITSSLEIPESHYGIWFWAVLVIAFSVWFVSRSK